VKGRYQSDLLWRFQVADHQMSGVPSSLEVLKKHWEMNGPSARGGGGAALFCTEIQMNASDRARRIDRVLQRLPAKPIDLARVLYLRYGLEEHRPFLREVLPNIAGVAAMTDAARKACEKANGKPPRPRSNDVLTWLDALCKRVATRKLVRDDLAVLADLRCDAERLLVEAENAYAGWADRAAA
jgi:hypothetical protein